MTNTKQGEVQEVENLWTVKFRFDIITALCLFVIFKNYFLLNCSIVFQRKNTTRVLSLQREIRTLPGHLIAQSQPDGGSCLSVCMFCHVLFLDLWMWYTYGQFYLDTLLWHARLKPNPITLCRQLHSIQRRWNENDRGMKSILNFLSLYIVFFRKTEKHDYGSNVFAKKCPIVG